MMMFHHVKATFEPRFQPCRGHVQRQQSRRILSHTTCGDTTRSSLVSSKMPGIGIVATIIMQSMLVWSAQADISKGVNHPRVDETNNEYIQSLLEKSERLREERREERLQHYYKKNFSEYFDYTGKVSSELQEEIDQWKEKATSIE